MIHGQLHNGRKAITPICWRRGAVRELVFYADNYLDEGALPVDLRLAIHSAMGGYHVHQLILDGSKGPTVFLLEDHWDVGAVSVQRRDEGRVNVAWAAA